MEEDLDSVTLLDENLWKIVEKKLMYINDPENEFSKPIATSSTYKDLNHLLEQMGKAKFQPSALQPLPKSRPTGSSLNFHREIDIQLEEVTNLLEKFQEKAEENEAEQELLAEEIHKESEQIQLLENTLTNTTEDFEEKVNFFVKLLADAERACKESKDLIGQGREKASLESTINKLEEELAKSALFIDDLQYKEKVLTEKLNKANTDYDYNLKRLKSEYETLHKQYSALKQVNLELSSNSASFSTLSQKELETYKSDLAKLTKAFNSVKEELSTKEEVHQSLKKTIFDLSEQLDTYKSLAKHSSNDLEKKSRQVDIESSNLQIELNKVKNSWMHDLEILAQIRLERDSIHTQYSLLDQKYNKVIQENKVLKSKIEELKQEARANFEAGKHQVPNDKSVKTATGSVTRMEVDYFRELENMKKTYEIELEKVAEELEWYKAKLETERQWSYSLELANKHLNEQIEEFRKQ